MVGIGKLADTDRQKDLVRGGPVATPNGPIDPTENSRRRILMDCMVLLISFDHSAYHVNEGLDPNIPGLSAVPRPPPETDGN